MPQLVICEVLLKQSVEGVLVKIYVHRCFRNDDLLTQLAEMVVSDFGCEVETGVKVLLQMDHRPVKVKLKSCILLTLDAYF